MTAQIYDFDLEGLARERSSLAQWLKDGRCPSELVTEFLDMIAEIDECLDNHGYQEYVS